MKFIIKKIYIIIFLLIVFLYENEVFAKDNKKTYTQENISNYFSGLVLSNENNYKDALKRFKKVKSLKDQHTNFNHEYIKTLVLLEKFDEAVNFSKKILVNNENLFNANLLVGLNLFINKDYLNAEKYFKKLNKSSDSNLFFENFIGNTLIAWSKASLGNKEDSFKYINKTPTSLNNFTKIQKTLLKCYFNSADVQQSFNILVNDKEYNFSRYSFFFANYLLSKDKKNESKQKILNSRKKYSENLLLKQAESFYLNGKSKKIENFFECENPNDSVAEFFYILANLYASEKNYELSNFYINISLFLNKKFLTNKTLLAENFYYQDLNKLSFDTYKSIKSIGSVYSWYAAKTIAFISIDDKGKKKSIKSLEKELKSKTDLTFEHYYDFANFCKDNEYFKKSIEFYSLTLEKIPKNHNLISKIFDRRGTSFERIGEWESAEKDLKESLRISPDEPHVLNYLAYTWIDKGINLDEALEMLKKAASMRQNNPYIIDSLGWAYFMKKDYSEAKFFLQRAVELLPSDPIINDHFADVLWMLNKNIQARYIWNSVLKFEKVDAKLKEKISKKLIFGITKKNIN